MVRLYWLGADPPSYLQICLVLWYGAGLKQIYGSTKITFWPSRDAPHACHIKGGLRVKSAHFFPTLKWFISLTVNHFSHTAGGIDASDVFGVGRVGVVAKQESCTRKSRLRTEKQRRPGAGPGDTHCAGWWACGRRCGLCRSGRGSTARCCWWRGRSRTSPCTRWPPGPWWEPRRCDDYGSQSAAPGSCQKLKKKKKKKKTFLIFPSSCLCHFPSFIGSKKTVVHTSKLILTYFIVTIVVNRITYTNP